MSVFVFLGSSLSAEQASKVLECQYLPPVQQGDILELLPSKPQAIGIIDGLFGAVPAVWHKEILAALAQGCHVFGASSMGALRAAELHPFGMRGVGQIFEAFRDGILEDDDEVAVSHTSGDYGYRELSVAMVNLRDRLEAAERAQILQQDEARALEAYAKSLFYPERSFQALLARARHWGWPEHKLQALSELFRTGGPLLKQRDALAMLEQMRSFLQTSPPPFSPAQPLPHTLFLRELARDVGRRRAPSRAFSDDASVAHTGLSLAELRKLALLRVLSRACRGQLGIEVTAEELGLVWDRIRSSAGWHTDADQESWLRREQLTAVELGRALEDLICMHEIERELAPQIERELPSLAAALALIPRQHDAQEA